VMWFYVVLVFLFWYSVVRDTRPTKKAPWGSTCWPILGNLPSLWQSRHRKLENVLDRVKAYGCFYMKIPQMPIELFISDLPSIQTVLSDVELFEIPDNRKLLGGDIFGEGIFLSNGESWRVQREMARPIFSLESRTGMYSVYQRSRNILISVLKKAAEQNKPVNIQTLFKRFTLDTFSEIGFGYRLDCLVEPVPFSEAFDYVLLEMDERIFNPLRTFKNRAEYQRNFNIVEDFVMKVIQHRRQQRDWVGKPDLLSRLLEMSESKEGSLPDKFIRDQLINFFVAGRDTTAILLTWASYFVSLNPDVEAKIREEILTEIGYGEPNMANTKKLKYVQMVLDEALRLYPPAVPFVNKRVARNCILPNGIELRQGQGVTYSPYVVHRLPQYWGDDCEEFKPERWEDPSVIKHPYQFIPFQKGPRICLGMNMAYEEAKSCLTLLYQNGIQFRLVPDQQVKYQAGVTVQAENGIEMFVTQLKTPQEDLS